MLFDCYKYGWGEPANSKTAEGPTRKCSRCFGSEPALVTNLYHDWPHRSPTHFLAGGSTAVDHTHADGATVWLGAVPEWRCGGPKAFAASVTTLLQTGEGCNLRPEGYRLVYTRG